jgi:hypothetical protein
MKIINSKPQIVRRGTFISNTDLKYGLNHIKDKIKKVKLDAQQILSQMGWSNSYEYETFNDQPESFFNPLCYDTTLPVPKSIEDCFGPFRYTYVIMGK